MRRPDRRRHRGPPRREIRRHQPRQRPAARRRRTARTRGDDPPCGRHRTGHPVLRDGRKRTASGKQRTAALPVPFRIQALDRRSPVRRRHDLRGTPRRLADPIRRQGGILRYPLPALRPVRPQEGPAKPAQVRLFQRIHFDGRRNHRGCGHRPTARGRGRHAVLLHRRSLAGSRGGQLAALHPGTAGRPAHSGASGRGKRRQADGERRRSSGNQARYAHPCEARRKNPAGRNRSDRLLAGGYVPPDRRIRAGVRGRGQAGLRRDGQP